jgi:pilus assembly protein CpaB
MSKMRILMFVLAIGSAVVAGLMAKGLLGKKQEVVATAAAPVLKTVDVLFASKDILMGDRMSAGTLTWKAWPQDNVLASMITKDAKPDSLVELENARARLAVYEGEPILEKKIIRPGAGGFMSATLPKGMRAVSVAISSRSSAGGFILPDDRVDVILTKKLDNKGSTVVKSETVISNVRVLAVNQVYRQATEGDAVSVEKGETATLELTPKQSEVLAQVESSGELSLALRSIAENDGKPADQIHPELAGKYNGDVKRVGNDTLIVRYGIETYATND